MQTILYFGSDEKGNQQTELRWEKGKKIPILGGIGTVVISGLEPPTHGFSVRCSTN